MARVTSPVPSATSSSYAATGSRRPTTTSATDTTYAAAMAPASPSSSSRAGCGSKSEIAPSVAPDAYRNARERASSDRSLPVAASPSPGAGSRVDEPRTATALSDDLVQLVDDGLWRHEDALGQLDVVGQRGAVQPPNLQPGALAQQPARGDVPRLNRALVVGVVATACRPCHIERRAAHAADVAHHGDQAADHLCLVPAHLGVVGEARGHQGGGQLLAVRCFERRPVERGGAGARGGEGLAAHRIVDDAGERTVVVLAGHADAPMGDAEQEVDGAIER